MRRDGPSVAHNASSRQVKRKSVKEIDLLVIIHCVRAAVVPESASRRVRRRKVVRLSENPFFWSFSTSLKRGANEIRTVIVATQP